MERIGLDLGQGPPERPGAASDGEGLRLRAGERGESLLGRTANRGELAAGVEPPAGDGQRIDPAVGVRVPGAEPAGGGVERG
jgi:hypothetical protein